MASEPSPAWSALKAALHAVAATNFSRNRDRFQAVSDFQVAWDNYKETADPDSEPPFVIEVPTTANTATKTVVALHDVATIKVKSIPKARASVLPGLKAFLLSACQLQGKGGGAVRSTTVSKVLGDLQLHQFPGYIRFCELSQHLKSSDSPLRVDIPVIAFNVLLPALTKQNTMEQIVAFAMEVLDSTTGRPLVSPAASRSLAVERGLLNPRKPHKRRAADTEELSPQEPATPLTTVDTPQNASASPAAEHVSSPVSEPHAGPPMQATAASGSPQKRARMSRLPAKLGDYQVTPSRKRQQESSKGPEPKHAKLHCTKLSDILTREQQHESRIQQELERPPLADPKVRGGSPSQSVQQEPQSESPRSPPQHHNLPNENHLSAKAQQDAQPALQQPRQPHRKQQLADQQPQQPQQQQPSSQQAQQQPPQSSSTHPYQNSQPAQEKTPQPHQNAQPAPQDPIPLAPNPPRQQEPVQSHQPEQQKPSLPLQNPPTHHTAAHADQHPPDPQRMHSNASTSCWHPHVGQTSTSQHPAGANQQGIAPDSLHKAGQKGGGRGGDESGPACASLAEVVSDSQGPSWETHQLERQERQSQSRRECQGNQPGSQPEAAPDSADTGSCLAALFDEARLLYDRANRLANQQTKHLQQVDAQVRQLDAENARLKQQIQEDKAGMLTVRQVIVQLGEQVSEMKGEKDKVMEDCERLKACNTRLEQEKQELQAQVEQFRQWQQAAARKEEALAKAKYWLKVADKPEA